MLAFLQKIGRSLMIPIAIMPAAALLLRLGAPDVLDIPFVQAAGSEIFNYLPLLFAAGVAIGMSEDQRGEAVLAAIVGYFVLLKSLDILLIEAGNPADSAIVAKMSGNVLIGIIAGLTSVFTYNRFGKVQLPEALGFFSGRRLVPILTSVFVLGVAWILRFIWPVVWNGLDAFNVIILKMGALGTAVFGFMNRLLIPLGLHHVLNSFFWFQLGEYEQADGSVVTGDIPRFLAGDPTAGAFQVGFFPIMMFGLAGGVLAMILAAKPANRKKIAGLLGSAALVSFFTGITEPLEFSFVFVAPFLYVIHALLTAASCYITNAMELRHGFGFSAGLVDFILNYGLASGPLKLLGVGIAFFFAYFGIFYTFIKMFKLKTPGSEDEKEISAEEHAALSADVVEGDDEHMIMAKGLLKAVGGLDNLTSVDNCATRLRLGVKDSTSVNDAAVNALGAKGLVKPSQTAVQIIIGVSVEFVADALKKVVASGGGVTAAGSETSQVAAVDQAEPAVIDDQARKKANRFIEALGGADNIIDAASVAATRLRATLKNTEKVDEAALRAAGATGVLTQENIVHVLVGLDAEQYGTAVQQEISGQ